MPLALSELSRRPNLLEKAMESKIAEILVELGEDPQREGLLKTPMRVAKAWRDMTAGYAEDPLAIIRSALFEVDNEEIVLVRDIDFASLCEHHMLPFLGKAHVAYLPRGRVVGLSKLARVVDVYSRRLQVQERMTTQVATALQQGLQPAGVAVVIEATHMCMVMRGVKKPNAVTVTSAMLGAFRDDPSTRAEVMKLIFAGRS
ncbi:MAG: GTP cyclohydrolase I FolE [Myxococcales bacterium]|nr:GTP cyclohydrolase I FolE [Myxococcales bacterium]